jgi:hypothetical protein
MLIKKKINTDINFVKNFLSKKFWHKNGANHKQITLTGLLSIRVVLFHYQ